jgi:thiol-disulfide isomerase/thioredoxin
MPDTIDVVRRHLLGSMAMAVVAGRLRMLEPPFDTTAPDSGISSARDELESLRRANAWLNSRALTAADLRSRVVLVQFWMFTCINWLRTMPSMRALAEKYGPAGLVIIGVHTPEFAFEQELDNVRRATRDLNVSYPVAIDNDYGIWRGFGNRYWPALYLFDANGRVQHSIFGEGAYERVAPKIQQLLMDTPSGASARIDRQIARADGRGIEAAADWGALKTPETYVGYERADLFASPGGVARDRAKVYELPRALRLNEWALAGDWTIRGGEIALNQSGGRIAFRFHARDLHLVMGPPPGAAQARFRVTLDGQPPAAAHGLDVDEQGNGMAKEQRLYPLIRQPKPIGDRTFQIEFLDRGVEAFSFTFG